MVLSLWQSKSMKAYSIDLRQKAVAAVAAGTPRGEVVRLFGLSLATLKRLLKQQRAVGHLQPQAQGGTQPRIAPEQETLLIAQWRAAADATLEEHCRTWQAQHGQIVSTATMSRALRRVGWTHKKRA
jgi:transposase